MENSSTNEEHENFDRQLPENSVEYLLLIPDNNLDARKKASQLEAVRKAALELCRDLAADYIWQRDGFNLELKNEGGLLYLSGVTDYGDAVEDEWLIVYLVRELTKSFPSLWARVFDSDGEFLLVEAANVLPKWLSPEIDHNRCWIHDGKLLILPLDDASTTSSQSISIQEAVNFIAAKPKAMVHSPFVESEAFYRLDKYPAQITDSLHQSVVIIPRRLAYVLHASPKSVAPAVEAFYLRDPLTLKPILSSTSALNFPPEDLVTVSVRFSKVLYAQLRSQYFDVPPRWQRILQEARSSPATSNGQADTEARRREVGMKLACGFEMLASKAASSKHRVVRELAIILEDLAEDGDGILPSDEEIKTWPDVLRDDSETWMDINYDDFERELQGKGTNEPGGKGKGFGDGNTQDKLRKIVSRFEAFLNDDHAGLDGAELEDMDMDDDDKDELDSDEVSDEEDKEVSFDEEEFSKMMREMMGLPSTASVSHAQARPTQESIRSTDRVKTTQDEEDEEIRDIASQLEAELNEHGALKLDAPESERQRIKGKGKAASKPQGVDDAANITDSGEQDDEDSDGPVDIDYNLAKNLLESFKSQGGMAGPTGNLLGLMGLQLPRDEDDEEDDEKVGASSSKQC